PSGKGICHSTRIAPGDNAVCRYRASLRCFLRRWKRASAIWREARSRPLEIDGEPNCAVIGIQHQAKNSAGRDAVSRDAGKGTGKARHSHKQSGLGCGTDVALPVHTVLAIAHFISDRDVGPTAKLPPSNASCALQPSLLRLSECGSLLLRVVPM